LFLHVYSGRVRLPIREVSRCARAGCESPYGNRKPSARIRPRGGAIPLVLRHQRVRNIRLSDRHRTLVVHGGFEFFGKAVGNQETDNIVQGLSLTPADLLFETPLRLFPKLIGLLEFGLAG
jgi:hypothetical protein